MLYFRIIQKLARKTNEFIGFLEANRWNKTTAMEILDQLVMLCNDSSCVFEKFCIPLEQKNKIVLRRINKKFELVACDSLTEKTSDLVCFYLKKSTSLLSEYLICSKNSSPCVCLLVILALLFLFFLVLPFIKYLFVTSTESTVYKINLSDQTTKSFLEENRSKMKDQAANVAKVFKLSALSSFLYDQLVAGDTQQKQSVTENNKSWSLILEYMQDIYVFMASLTAFISFEWIFNR